MAKSQKKADRPKEIKVTIPAAQWPLVQEAMRLDGATSPAVFARAAILQRARRIKEQEAPEPKS